MRKGKKCRFLFRYAPLIIALLRQTATVGRTTIATICAKNERNHFYNNILFKCSGLKKFNEQGVVHAVLKLFMGILGNIMPQERGNNQANPIL